MGAAHEQLIAIVLGACCIIIFLFEIVKRMEPEVTIEKVIALVLAAAWLVAASIALCLAGQMKEAPMLVLAMLLPLGLIWFGDELGDLTGIRAGLVTKRSPGFLIRMFGWLFLLVIIGGTIFGVTAHPS